jgi:hypothetical protein
MHAGKGSQLLLKTPEVVTYPSIGRCIDLFVENSDSQLQCILGTMNDFFEQELPIGDFGFKLFDPARDAMT